MASRAPRRPHSRSRRPRPPTPARSPALTSRPTSPVSPTPSRALPTSASTSLPSSPSPPPATAPPPPPSPPASPHASARSPCSSSRRTSRSRRGPPSRPPARSAHGCERAPPVPARPTGVCERRRPEMVIRRGSSYAVLALLALASVASLIGFFQEKFEDGWESRWVKSEWKKDENMAATVLYPMPPSASFCACCGQAAWLASPRRAILLTVIFPSLMQLEHGISDPDDCRQRAVCSERYRRRDEPEDSKRPIYKIDAEIEEECGICMELNSRVVLPNCSHDMCINCYRQ